MNILEDYFLESHLTQNAVRQFLMNTGDLMGLHFSSLGIAPETKDIVLGHIGFPALIAFSNEDDLSIEDLEAIQESFRFHAKEVGKCIKNKKAKGRK